MDLQLKDKIAIVTGSSRGLGLAMARSLAAEGCRVCLSARTEAPLRAAAEAVAAIGGDPRRVTAVAADVSQPQGVQSIIDGAVAAFGGIDILVNNASAIQLTGTLACDMKRYDLMNGVNTRGTYLAGRSCIPHLKKSSNPHILTLSPPLDLAPKWFAPHVAYSIAKYGMSLCTLAWAAEFRNDGIAANALWPRTTIATAAVQMLGGEAMMSQSRKPEIMADAAHAILSKPSREFTGNFCIDDLVLHAAGVRDFSKYAAVPGSTKFVPDFFVPDDTPALPA